MLKLFAKAVVGTSKSAVFRPFSTLIGRYDGDGRSTFTLGTVYVVRFVLEHSIIIDAL